MKSFQSRPLLVIHFLSLMLGLVAAGQEGAAALPAELATLDVQFQALQKERVIQPFELELSRLNTAYLGGLENASAAEKAKGDLDATLALQSEKQAFTKLPEVPEKDEPSTPETLKRLRTTYRSAAEKISAARAANLALLTEPLGKRLVELEKALTKADRLEDAKKIRAYREALGTSPNANPATMAAGSNGFTNTLGMKFMPVKGTEVMFCIHETRRQDYAAFAADASGVDESWKQQQFKGIPCGDKDDHPVVGVGWEDAVKFCEWLSKKEGKTYRLPTDAEWSIAVGLGDRESRSKETTPEMLNSQEQTLLPWEGDYPPKSEDKAGNYADTASPEKVPAGSGLKDYTDGFATTAPVMSFKVNPFGLYDMGGNVWEWVDDMWSESKTDRVLRGASYIDHDRNYLLSSYRTLLSPVGRRCHIGFRIVMVAR